MCPEPIRDYVGEALARSLNGKAASVGTDSGGNDAMSPANRVGFNGGGFAPKQPESQQQEQPTPPPIEPQRRRGSFTAEQLQAMNFPPAAFPCRCSRHSPRL
jgi:hypothetical protein